MADYKSKFLVPPDKKIKLKHFDPGYQGKFTSEEEAAPYIEKYLAKMVKLQGLMYGENKHSLLIVLQGLDTAGKDGVITHVFRGLNPHGCGATSFKEPTPEEAAHDFLWRVHPHVPRKGAIAIFNRSHYEDVLIAKVHKLFPKEVISGRYEIINHFEEMLAAENGTTILKFFLHISKDEQLSRFGQRLEDPSRHWKISDTDYSEREYWEDYQEAFELVLAKTSTEHAPWFIIPSDHKWFRNLAISQIIATTLEDLGLQEPEPTADLDKIRKQYKLAITEAKASRKKK